MALLKPITSGTLPRSGVEHRPMMAHVYWFLAQSGACFVLTAPWYSIVRYSPYSSYISSNGPAQINSRTSGRLAAEVQSHS